MTIADPTQLRADLTDQLCRRSRIRTPQVEAAFRRVPRHLFLPGVDQRTAYAAHVVVTKPAEDGTAISSASSPGVVADMLEQLEVQPGHRVLEIGAATGINAALLQELVGPAGHVTTIDIDPDLVEGARRGLSAAGYDQLDVICGDGVDGHPPRAPFDRIIVTAGAWDLAPAWWRQLVAGGRLVVPLRLHGSGLTRSIAFDLPHPDRMLSSSVLVCGFVPMRGAAAQTERSCPLGADVILHLGAGDPIDEAMAKDALSYPLSRAPGLDRCDDQRRRSRRAPRPVAGHRHQPLRQNLRRTPSTRNRVGHPCPPMGRSRPLRPRDPRLPCGTPPTAATPPNWA